MKPSRYNVLLQVSNDLVLAYNTLSGALAHFTRAQYSQVQQLLTQPPESATSESDDYLKFLVEGRFLIENDVDELDILKIRHLLGKFRQDKLGVTVMLTLNCNFRCIYCFEEHKNETLQPFGTF